MTGERDDLGSVTFDELMETKRILQDLGLSSADLKAIRRTRGAAKRLVAFWKRDCGGLEYKDTHSQAAARAIMGKNFLGLREVNEAFAYGFSEIESDLKLETVPFPEELLQSCKDTHVLFCGAALTLRDMQKRGGTFVGEVTAASYMPEPRWHLIRKEPRDSQQDKSYNQLVAGLRPNERVPPLVTMAYMSALYDMIHGEPPFRDYCFCRMSPDTPLVPMVLCPSAVDGQYCHWHFSKPYSADQPYQGAGLAVEIIPSS